MRSGHGAGLLALAMVGIVVLGSAGCGGDSTESPSAKDSSPDQKSIRIGVVYDTRTQGDGVQAAVRAGLEKVSDAMDVDQRELAAADDETVEDKYQRLSLLCDAGYDPIIVAGFSYVGADPASGPLARAASECPTTRFAVVDETGVTGDNIASLTFANEQGSFLMGVAAALSSETGVVGFVGGCDIASVRSYQAGYTAGAEAVNPDVVVVTGYVSTTAEACSGFFDDATAQIVTGSLIDGGADVVYHAAREAADGVFQAVRERGQRAIGSDADQYTTRSQFKSVILTSMTKRVDSAVYDFVTNAANGAFTSGITRSDLAANGVGYATSGGAIDDDKATIDDYRQKIVSGSIKVPTDPM